MVSNIRNDLIDVDFQAEASSAGRLTGCNPRLTVCGEEHLVFEDNFDLIPESEWDDLIEKSPDLLDYSPYQHDQDGEGSCASNSAGGCYETMFVQQFGYGKFVPVSPVSLYKRVGSSPNSGSSLDSNLRELRDHGILPLDTPENKARFDHTFPHNGFYEKLPDGWEETGELLRMREWWDVATVEGAITACFKGFPGCYARDGHAIKIVALVKKDGKRFIKYHNSWGDWGDNGYGYDTLDKARQGIRQYGMWVPRAIVTPDELLRRLEMKR
jgi:hypothetical protein